MTKLFHQAMEIWVSGGWAMIALALDGAILFTIGFDLWFRLRARGFRSMPERRWRRWLSSPSEREGVMGELIGFVLEARDLKDLTTRFGELRHAEIAPFQRDLRFMRRSVSAAPLLGLLGTVTGMLLTFHGLASGTGGDKTMNIVAGGISEALVTTETGLVIALAGLFFHYHLARERDRYDSFLTHVETACAQHLYRAQGRAEGNPAEGTEP